MLLYDVFFFFSSRRRHTRSYGDWSSDVCSSDLGRAADARRDLARHHRRLEMSRGAALRDRQVGGVSDGEDGVELLVLERCPADWNPAALVTQSGVLDHLGPAVRRNQHE